MNLVEIGILIDTYNAARVHRLAEQKNVDLLEVEEKGLKAELIAALKEGEITAAGGKTAIAKLVIRNEPAVKSIDDLYRHIRETGHFDLLYRRINTLAVKQRWDQGVVVPGVESYPVESLSLSQIKE
jgi:hypothetical protein